MVGLDELRGLFLNDGWTKDPDRYVWGSCVGTWNYVTVELN